MKGGKALNVYLVGGAVRDELLGYPALDQDWLVVGSTPEQMLAKGYQAVGKDFPVFLHPKTKQEYALARIERKQGQGYTGFACYFAPDVSLEQDLLRRDLTINAIAKDAQGNLHDPYHGARDLAQKILRHVSPAFSEDPLRVLRVARFYARYAHLGFTIASETLELMTQLSQSGELEHLTPERVWQETARALQEKNPEAYFAVLKHVGALAVLMPELEALWSQPAHEQEQRSLNAGEQALRVLTHAASLSPLTEVRFAALCHSVGQSAFAADAPGEPQHSVTSLLRAMCERLRVPNDCKELALLANQYQLPLQRAFELSPQTLLSLFNGIDLWRKPERFTLLLVCAEADMRAQKAPLEQEFSQKAYLEQAAKAAQGVDVKAIVALGLKGEAIKHQLAEHRLDAVTQVKQQWDQATQM